MNNKEGLLVIICSVCTEPIGIRRKGEAYLLYIKSITCPTCNQTTDIDEKLRSYLKRCNNI